MRPTVPTIHVPVGGNGQPTEYAGVLSGSGGLTKSGAGTLQLTGDNDYSGTTSVSSGILDIGGSLTNSLIEISGGVLAGNGRVKSVDLNGGTLSPGHGVGTLTISLGAILDNGAVEIELSDGTATDQLLVLNGDVVLGSELSLAADANFQPTTAAVIAVVNNSGNGATTGLFTGVLPGQTVTFNNHQYRLLYDYDFGGDGLTNDVVLEPVQSIPAAVADEYVLDEDTLLTLAAPGVLANDTDAEGDPLTATLVQPPAHGTVTLHPDGSFTYTPNADFSGVDDALVYRIDDGHGNTAEGTVTFRVQPTNDAPVVGANAFRTVEGSNLAGQLVATDVDSAPLTYVLVTPPTHGDVIVNPDGTFTYKSHGLTQAVNDQFTFAVNDGVATTTGTATVAVLNWNGSGIRPDVLEWILANNPGLQANFLKTELPSKVIRLPDGRSLPIYQLDQFLDVNFQLTFSARKREGVALVEEQEWQMRKIMAHPQFYNWIKSFAPRYNIAGRGWLSSSETYQFFRNLNRNLSVGVNPRVKAPVGGGGGMTAPSWAVWKQMNIFWHEAMHNVGVGHNTVGLSGPLAGKMRDWDRAKLWNYNTVDLNSLTVPLR
jgi:autotransporter-associated beta strand protein/VCBS repeat-containing protein